MKTSKRGSFSFSKPLLVLVCLFFLAAAWAPLSAYAGGDGPISLEATLEQIDRLEQQIIAMQREIEALRKRVGVTQSTSAPPSTAVAPTAALKADSAKEDLTFDLLLSGAWSTDIYSQNHFTLGKSAYKDQYAWQGLLLRPQLQFGKNVRVITRTYLGKGVWGLDNEPADRTGGFSRQFNNKETKFLFHTLWLYVDVNLPGSDTNLKIGRQKFGLGNLLALDTNFDGIQATQSLGKKGGQLTLGWAKVHEGADSLSDAVTGTLDARDATLYLASYQFKKGTYLVNPFYAFYNDAARQDVRTFVPERLAYQRARFRPQISNVGLFGLMAQTEQKGIVLKGEFDLLRGRDAIANSDSGPAELLDINDGRLRGYNLLLDAKYSRGRSSIGALFGRGSGDRDVASGSGNVNGIVTQGFWYATEVWEDSIMPDEEGITPQGMGSPSVRGYRELENTTLIQLSAGRSLMGQLRLSGAYNYLHATRPVRAWSDLNGDGRISAGEFLAPRSQKLGQEFWGRADYTISPGLTATLRGGIFRPGEAASILINGSPAYHRSAWELRGTIFYLFEDISFRKLTQ
ncbi:MAG: hypothetical protein HY645_05250 [Acidobacteria bacterium]|nr:hypothetical protein [Acidobacteriota bacterium]